MASTSQKERAFIIKVTEESGSYDNTISGAMSDSIKGVIDELKQVCNDIMGDVGGMDDHAAVTLNADQPTQDTLNLSTQELQVNLVTTSTHGAMSSTDKTKLDGIASGAEVNVQADWDAVSGDAFILNKPTINSDLSDFSGDMDDIDDGATYVKTENNFTDTLKTKLDGIADGAEVNVQSDWDAVSGDAFILNKPLFGLDFVHDQTISVQVDYTSENIWLDTGLEYEIEEDGTYLIIYNTSIGLGTSSTNLNIFRSALEIDNSTLTSQTYISTHAGTTIASSSIILALTAEQILKVVIQYNTSNGNAGLCGVGSYFQVLKLF